MSAHAEHAADSPLQHHFEDLAQQKEAANLGMWVFLVTEIMFFGGLFTAYILFRTLYPHAFALASHELDVKLGAINTGILLLSSLTMALAVRGAQTAKRAALLGFLAATIILGTAFLGIKAIEYHHKIVEHHVPGAGFSFDGPREVQIFFVLYFAMTGLHALHMIIGIALLGCFMVPAARGRYTPEYHNPIEGIGLYWHFVDIVWIFLFPLLYLIERHG